MACTSVYQVVRVNVTDRVVAMRAARLVSGIFPGVSFNVQVGELVIPRSVDPDRVRRMFAQAQTAIVIERAIAKTYMTVAPTTRYQDGAWHIVDERGKSLAMLRGNILVTSLEGLGPLPVGMVRGYGVEVAMQAEGHRSGQSHTHVHA